MSVEVSCPVFRCDKTSVRQCTGHRKACERYYCTAHSKGTLCERCANLKREEMKSGYLHMLKGLERKSYSASLTAGVIALFSISILLLFAALLFAFRIKSNQDALALFVISLIAGAACFFGSLVWYVMKAREYVRSESIELDLTHPGFYDAYQERQAKIDDITSNYS
jgi:hypothetical protein